MRTLTQLAGKSVSARIQALAAIVIEGPAQRSKSAAEEAIELLHSLIRNTSREDEQLMLKDTITAFVGASRPHSQAFDRRRLMKCLSVAKGYLRR